MQTQPVTYQGQTGAVTIQPNQSSQMQWMPKPVVAGCPPGLEYLAQVDQLLVHQTREVFEMLTSWETANRYRIVNTMGQQVYYAFEESGGFARQFFGNWRDFTMHIVDNIKQEVIRVQRPNLQEIVIEAPVGVVVGYAQQNGSCWDESFTVCDAARTPVFHVQGPSCTICCPSCGDYDFNITSLGNDGAQIGRITKQWSGFISEAFTDADNFGISFPANLDVRMKATLLGLLFLVDFVFFESNK